MNNMAGLLAQIHDKLISDCVRGWVRYTESHIVNPANYTYEEQMKIGDREAWRLLQEVNRHLFNAVEEEETVSDLSSETRQFTLD